MSGFTHRLCIGNSGAMELPDRGRPRHTLTGRVKAPAFHKSAHGSSTSSPFGPIALHVGPISRASAEIDTGAVPAAAHNGRFPNTDDCCHPALNLAKLWAHHDE
jgi:hypothetical protein